jgi:hypothetical protein
VRTSPATTAKPRPCSPARRFHGGIQGQDIGLECDALDDGDDVSHLARTDADGIHRFHDIADDRATALGDAGRRSRKPVGGARAFGVLPDHRSQFAHARRGFLQRGRLLLGPLRQIGVAHGDLLRCRRNRIAGGLDARDQVGQHVFHLSQAAEQTTEIATALGFEILAQIAGSHRLRNEFGLLERRLDRTGQTGPAHYAEHRHGSAQPIEPTSRALIGDLAQRQRHHDGHQHHHHPKCRAQPDAHAQVIPRHFYPLLFRAPRCPGLSMD